MASVGQLQEKINTVVVVGAPLVVDCDCDPLTHDVVRQFHANEAATLTGGAFFLTHGPVPASPRQSALPSGFRRLHVSRVVFPQPRDPAAV